MAANVAQFPESLEEFVSRAHEFRSRVKDAKAEPLGRDLAWYPYDSLASIDHAGLCLEDCFPEFVRAMRSGPMLDIGCADGDLAMFFAWLGSEVTAIDHRPTNHNWMNGIHALSERLRLPVHVLEADVDGEWPALPHGFGLTLLLGILYHLKNPFHVLETLATQSRYCLLSTRIAELTPKHHRMRGESLAYLLEGGQTNNDDTNYWIFSATALDVLARRSGWKVLGRATVGHTKGRSEPVRADRDAREFLFLRSQRLSLPAQVTLSSGWGEPEEHGWAWTLKEFSLHVVPEAGEHARGFRLSFRVPAVVAEQSPQVAMGCAVNGIQLERRLYRGAGEFIYEAALPELATRDSELYFGFQVEHSFRPNGPDPRELGVIVEMRGTVRGISAKIPFYLD